MIEQDYHLHGSKPWRIKSSDEHVGARTNRSMCGPARRFPNGKLRFLLQREIERLTANPPAPRLRRDRLRGSHGSLKSIGSHKIYQERRKLAVWTPVTSENLIRDGHLPGIAAAQPRFALR